MTEKLTDEYLKLYAENPVCIVEDDGRKMARELLDLRRATSADDLRAALEPFAEFARASGFSKLPDDLPMTQGSRLARRQVTAGDFKRALATLNQKEPTQ